MPTLRPTGARGPDAMRSPDDRLGPQSFCATERARPGPHAGRRTAGPVRANSAGPARFSADHEFLVRTADPAAHLLHGAAPGVLDIPVAAPGGNPVPPGT